MDLRIFRAYWESLARISRAKEAALLSVAALTAEWRLRLPLADCLGRGDIVALDARERSCAQRPLAHGGQRERPTP